MGPPLIALVVAQVGQQVFQNICMAMDVTDEINCHRVALSPRSVVCKRVHCGMGVGCNMPP